MKPIEIIVIIAAVAIVAGVIIASIVRKLKGKPSLGSDCAGCSHAGQCNGKCCSNIQSTFTPSRRYLIFLHCQRQCFHRIVPK